eukprot:TRINITY_DN16200_c0_g1_i2.p1 TRINITY_DN16200_c0_g1~~TRINITY_DN16200_c0_g1_i2.p1  ORF type:complete len:173 (+),score=8.24 TRINITY_DN16200_c0_g1_i2:105-623(+)
MSMRIWFIAVVLVAMQCRARDTTATRPSSFTLPTPAACWPAPNVSDYRKLKDEICVPFKRHLHDFAKSEGKQGKHVCPCCGAIFDSFATWLKRPNAMCPRCGAYERHRHACATISDMNLLEPVVGRFRATRVLSFGPHASMEASINRVCPEARVDHIGVDMSAQGGPGEREQ